MNTLISLKPADADQNAERDRDAPVSLRPSTIDACRHTALEPACGEPWFVLTDVCRVLKYRSASDAGRILDDEEKGTQNVRTLGGFRSLIVVNELGLYKHALDMTPDGEGEQ